MYLPARDHNPWIDRLGWLAVAAVVAGVIVHAGARVLTRMRKGAQGTH